VQRPTCALDGVSAAARCAMHLLATNAIERVVREALHVKAVVDERRIRASCLDGRRERWREVHADGFERGSPFLAELVEESVERVGTLARSRPHDVSVLVDDHCDVVVVPLVAQLVDRDVAKPVERIADAHSLGNATRDTTNRLPGDAHHATDGGLVGALREKREGQLEVAREPTVVRRPRHHLRRHTAARTPYATDLRRKPALDSHHVEVTPSSPPSIVNVFAPSPARAAARLRAELYVENDRLRLEIDSSDSRPLDTEQLRQYTRCAHGGLGLSAWRGNQQFAAPPCASFPSRRYARAAACFTRSRRRKPSAALPPTCAESHFSACSLVASPR